MIKDANDIPANTVLHADLCIVGGGAAGITLALALQDSGLSIILLESGGDKPDAQAQKLYEGTVADERMHTLPDRYRVRQLGGSTSIWGGRCMPFDAIDFEPRDYIAHSGWPIGIDALLPHYPLANALCEAGAFAYTAETAFDHPIRPMIEGFASAAFTTNTLERFSCPTNFGARYRAQLDNATLTVLQNANLSGLATDTSGKHVGPASVRTLKGGVFTVQARAYVLATGGLEVARLLLNSPGPSGRGLGNTHDNVGRYYMCHIAGTIGTLDLARATSVWHGYEIDADGIYCRQRLALRPEAQHRLHSGNFVARLHHPRIPDAGHGNGILSMLYLARPFIPYEYGKRLYGDEKSTLALWFAHLRNVILGAPATAAFLLHWVKRRTLAKRKFPSIIVHSKNKRYSLDFHAEQEPNPESRVTLGDTTDALGMRQLRVDWRYTARDVSTVTAALATLAADLEASGVGRLEYDPTQVEAEMTRYGAYGGHHIGTARMGVDPKTSVVDTDCRVHDTANLYVASAAVFPTSSQANPTLTVVAMALRLADHLRRTYTPAADPASANSTGKTSKMRVLVLGAKGYVGARVVAALAASDWATPIATTRRTPAPGERQLDATDAVALQLAFKEVDAVVNCVAASPEAMIAGAHALRVAQDTRPNGPLPLVHFSSMAVYGSATGVVREDSPLLDDLGGYGHGKIRAEALLTGQPCVVTLRPGCIYGPASPQWSERIANLLRAGRIGDLGAIGQHCSNLVHIDDVVAAVLAALRSPQASGQAYNLVMADAPSWNEYFAAYAEALGLGPLKSISPSRLKLESLVAAPMLKIAEIAGRKIGLRDLPPPIPPSLRKLWAQDIRLVSDKARSDLGTSWTPLDQGVRTQSAPQAPTSI